MPKKRIIGLVLMGLQIIAIIGSYATNGGLPKNVQAALNGDDVIWGAVGYFLIGIIGLFMFILSFNKKDKE